MVFSPVSPYITFRTVSFTPYLDYRHQEDENVASRGSIAMKTATLKISPGGEKLRFEVQSSPSRGHRSSGVQKWYMKANHPVEASRWTQAIGRSIEWYKRDGPDTEPRRNSGDTQSSLVKTHSQRSKRGSISTMPRQRHETVSQGNDSTTSNFETGDEEDASLIIRDNTPDDGGFDDGAEQNDDSSAAESTCQVPPYDTSFDLHGNSTTAQMELTSQLLSNLAISPTASPRTQELKTALKDSFAMVQDMMNEYVQMAKERDEWWRLKLKREQERQAVWEESLQNVVKEGETLERELRLRSRRRGSRFFDSGAGEVDGTVRQRPSLLPIVQSPIPEETGKGDYFPASSNIAAPVIIIPTAQADGTSTEQEVSPSVLTPTRRQLSMPPRDQVDSASLADTDEEDEFFDAIEANNLPNLDVHEFLASPIHSEQMLPSTVLEQYAGYKHLRDRLPIGNDNRPSTSLWSVLKHSIGKDLTKISFPVFFNEPTSMLQRMASSHAVIATIICS